MRVAAFHWLLLFAMSAIGFANAAGPVDVVLPRVKSIRLTPNDYNVPYTRLGFEAELKAKLHRPQLYSGQTVRIEPGQRLEIWSDQLEELDANLAIYNNIPSDSLHRLSLSFNRMPKDGYSPLGRFSNLRFLSLRTDDFDFVELIKHCPQIEMLELYSTDVRTDGSQGPSFSNATMAKLHHFKELKCVRIQGRKITDDGFGELKALPKLEVFEAVRTERISDAGLNTLSTLSSLTELGLEINPGMTVRGLKAVAALPKLKLLVLYGGNRLPKSVITELRDGFPGIRINIEP